MPDREPVPESPEILLVKKAVQDLMEHFDSVQIFATRCDPGDRTTLDVATGLGNFYARYGQIREWLIIQDEGSRASAETNSKIEED